MLKKTNILVSNCDINAALDQINFVGKHAINQPTGNFFYDPWTIKEEYKNTIWETLIKDLPDIGEARIIILNAPSCYHQHADIDDRFHLNLSGDSAYLIDIINQNMFKLDNDGIWYDMDAGRIHTAVNIGTTSRVQLVVRKLLLKNVLLDPKHVIVNPIEYKEEFRYIFDNTISPWLNYSNKNRTISNFIFKSPTIEFDIESFLISEFKKLLPSQFKLEITT